MEAIQREARARDRDMYQTYEILFARVAKLIEEEVADSKVQSVFPIPCSLPGRPRYDPNAMAHMIKLTLEQQRIAVLITQQEGIEFLFMHWGREPIMKRKKKVYEELLHRCNKAVELYVESHLYRVSRKREFSFTIPTMVYGFARYNPYDASLYLAERLREDGFQVQETVNARSQTPMLILSW
jgi:hypothetical protein